MPGIMDMLNQGLGNVVGTPLGQLGINMLMNAGPQQGNPNAGTRMGQAFGGMQQMHAQQQQLDYTAALRKQQEQELAVRQQQFQLAQNQRQALKDLAAKDPSFLADNPMARAMIGATGDTGMAADIAKLAPIQKPPTMPGVYNKTNADGTISQQIYNPTTKSYDAGPSYTPTDLMRATAYVDKTNQDIQYKPEEVGIASSNAEAARQRVQVAQTDAARKQSKAALESRVTQEQLRQGFQGATTQLDENIALADELLKPDSGLDGNFGARGWIPNAPGIDAANARAQLERLKARSGLTELTRLGNQGIRLTPVSDNDIKVVQSSAMNMDKNQDATSARKELTRYRDTLVKAKQEAADNYNGLIGAYNPQGQQQQAPAPGQPTRINNDADYNSLPSGATFVAPDGSMRRKP